MLLGVSVHQFQIGDDHTVQEGSELLVFAAEKFEEYGQDSSCGYVILTSHNS